MADSEKLTALKKAYADIILNTAKEAAARIMVSERKALRYQQELFNAKDEALRMLLRLKQMFDAKVNEADTSSLSQQRRIEELEAQLGEAEDIVRDLRAELSEVHEELEKVTDKQTQLLDEQIPKSDIASQATTSEENRFNASGSVISSLPEAQPGLVSTADMKNLTLNGTYEGNKCYSEYGSHKDNCFAFNSDFASIVMRNKEPELYRNGCTQRIRAFERILLDGNLPLSGQVDSEKNEKSIREDEEDNNNICIKLPPKSANMCEGEENPDELKVVQAGSNSIQVLAAVKSFRRKRKRATRYKKSKLSSFRNFPNQVIETSQAPDLSCPETFAYAVDNDVQSREISRATEEKDQNDPDSPLGPKLPTDATDMLTQSGCADVTKSDAEFLKACTVRNMTNNDQVLIGDSQLTRQESESTDNSEVPACKRDLETVNASIENSDVKASDLTEGLSTQSVDNRFLKYTFQRKRKKESLSSPDRDSSLDKSTSKRKTEENNSLDLQKSGLITESSRDTRRLAQVARQLISLSEKKWR